jgi:1,4-dihydroxy-2-naphthoyl-CoA synthase
MPLKSILLIKKSIKDSEYEKSTSDPAELRNERDLVYSFFDTEDSIEGINAFKEKRDPNFLDK